MNRSDHNRPRKGSPENHTRVNESFIARNERTALLWLSERMPAWVSPDGLTLIGFLGAVLIFISYALTLIHPAFLWLASFGFVLNWFGDSLDGTLARYRHIERPRYGYFVDHMIDTVSEVLVFIGLGVSPYLHFDLALLALISYLMASIYVFLATYTSGVFRLTYGEVSPTTMRMVAVVTNTLVFFIGNPHVSIPTAGLLRAPVSATLYDLVVVGVIVVILYLLVENTIATARSLSNEDREARLARKLEARALKTGALKAQREEHPLD